MKAIWKVTVIEQLWTVKKLQGFFFVFTADHFFLCIF